MREMSKVFAENKEAYRLRDLTVFGGLEIKYGNRTRCRCTNSRKDDCLLMVVSHNLRTYMRAAALRKLGIFIFLFIGQPRFHDHNHPPPQYLGLVFKNISSNTADQEI